MIKRFALYTLILALALGIGLADGHHPPQAQAEPGRQFDDPVEQGRYLANVGACVFCHTPFQEQYLAEDEADLGQEQIRTLALFEGTALDREQEFAGGHLFELGAAGSVLSANITPHEETGIGTWSEEEIVTTLQTGVNPDGRPLYPIMPRYVGMAQTDLEALAAYLLTLEPVENEIERAPALEIPPAPVPSEPVVAPDSSDLSARGEYLVRNVLSCGECHTPRDPETGQFIEDRLLSGGQPFEGPYGIVYAGNITPHETGIGDWTEEDIKRAITQGVRIDGRRLGLMPWQFYAGLTPEDLDAVVHYLKNDLPAVESNIPATALEEPYIEFVEIEQSRSETSEDDDNGLALGLLGGLLVILVGGGLLIYKRRQQATSSTES